MRDCPVGWTQNDTFSSRTIRAVSGAPGGIGGSDTTGGSCSLRYDAGGYAKEFGCAGPLPNWPPYINVIICCKN